MADTEHWNFVQDWPMVAACRRPWRLGERHDADPRRTSPATGSRAAGRHAEEYAARTGTANPPTQPPATRRFLLEASMVDYAAYYGGRRPPSSSGRPRRRVSRLRPWCSRPMQAEMCRTGGEADYQPTVTALASYELLD